jgi:hypothetical protein
MLSRVKCFPNPFNKVSSPTCRLLTKPELVWVGWMAARMRWAKFRGPGPANRLQTAIFGDSEEICKTRIQQQQTAAAEFGTFLLKTAMAHMEGRNPAADDRRVICGKVNHVPVVRSRGRKRRKRSRRMRGCAKRSAALGLGLRTKSRKRRVRVDCQRTTSHACRHRNP